MLDLKYKSLESYVPGEQPRDKSYIKLNTNELPYPPPQSVIQAATREAEQLNLYSDPTAKALISSLASTYKVPESCVFAGNGSDEVLSLLFMGFCGDGVIFPEISYGFYPVYARLYGLKYCCPELKDDLSVDYRDYLSTGGTVVIANPNAPTGLCLSLDEIEEILKTNPSHPVIIDEAYVDFGGESATSLLAKYDNLVVVMTFSKSRALAGGRLGFALASPEITEGLNRLKYSINPYNINRMTLACGVAALSEEKYFKDCAQRVIKTRKKLTDGLRSLGFFVTDSRSNFVFASHDRLGGGEYYRLLRENGVLVRHFDTEKIKNYVRITVGTDTEIEKLLEITKNILYNKG